MKKNLDYTVLFEDEYIIAFNKRSGILTAADSYDPDVPRLDVLAEPQYGKLFAVHRIDKDTSGVIIYAKTQEAHREMCVLFEKRQIQKTYHALVYGRPLWNEHTCEAPLLIDGDARHRSVINRRHGKPSKTNFTLLGSCNAFSWIQASPVTGRTHQIRAHLLNEGFQIVCDPLYGGNQKSIKLSDIKRSYKGDIFEERPLLNRLALHAYKIEFVHPFTSENICITAPYSKDMDSLRKQLAKIYKVDPLRSQDETEEC